MSDREVIIPEGMEAFYERFHFAPAIRDGARVICSGQLGSGPDGRVVAGAEEQFAQAWRNVEAVLEAAGAKLADVVEIVTYHVDMADHLGTFMAAKDRFVREPYPAWTAIGVSALAMPGALVEIKVTAHLDR